MGARGLRDRKGRQPMTDRDARARKVARLWASGLSIREVARRVGIHHQTAIDDLARSDPSSPGWETYRQRRQRRRIPGRDKRMAAAAALRAAGKSLRDIGKELGVSYQTVSNDLARWDAQQPTIPANVIPLSRNRQKVAGKSSPGGGKKARQKLTAGKTS
jgi:transposase